MKNYKSFVLNFIFVFVFLFIFVLSGCIREKESISYNDKILAEKENGVTVIYTKDNLMGIEVSVKGEISESNIIVSDDKIKVVYFDGERTNIAVASKNEEININQEIVRITSGDIESIDVSEFVKTISVKSSAKDKKEIKLLGDYDNNKIVDLNDFLIFKQNYGKENSMVDIAPALKGTGDAQDIYCKNYGDGAVNLKDLVVFSLNFGKTVPVDKIEISDSNLVIKKGEKLQLNVKLYGNGAEKESEINWEIEEGEDIVNIENNGLLTGLKSGTAKIKAELFGISTTILINVLESDYYEDGSFITYMKNQKDETRAINVIIMGDGYIKEDLKKDGNYEKEAKKIIDGIFKIPPFSQYKEKFNAYIIFCESKERGADYTQSKDEIDTVFNSNYGQNGIDRLLVIKNYAKVSEYISKAGLISKNALGKNIMIISVNDSKYGGSGGTYSVISKHKSSVQIAAHEIGHSFGGLADEYDYGETYPKSNAAHQKNVDVTNKLKEIKWSYFIGVEGYEDVGAYEGGYYYYTGVWRPTKNCLMKELGSDFCPICREAIVKTIYSCVKDEYSFTQFILNDKVNLNKKKSKSETDETYPEMFPDDLRVLE